jgi:hypothetical protein
LTGAYLQSSKLALNYMPLNASASIWIASGNLISLKKQWPLQKAGENFHAPGFNNGFGAQAYS